MGIHMGFHVTQVTDINMALGLIRTPDPLKALVTAWTTSLTMVSGSYICHSHRLVGGLLATQWTQGPEGSTCLGQVCFF